MARRGLAGAEKKARAGGSAIVCIEEAGFYLLPGLVRTYAPRGRTPVLKVLSSYSHLSVMSGITEAGQLYTLVRARALTSRDSVGFLRHVSRCVGRKLLVVWDGSPIHRKEVEKFMGDGGAERIGLERLPAYAPDLNPDEGVWQHLLKDPCGSIFHTAQNQLENRRARARYPAAKPIR